MNEWWVHFDPLLVTEQDLPVVGPTTLTPDYRNVTLEKVSLSTTPGLKIPQHSLFVLLRTRWSRSLLDLAHPSSSFSVRSRTEKFVREKDRDRIRCPQTTESR